MGLYTNWNYFVPKSRKTNLISTLTHCALMLCSRIFDKEVENIYIIFNDDVYSENIMKFTVERNIKYFTAAVVLVLTCAPYI